MLKFIEDLQIEAPVDRVMKLFHDRSRMTEWQPGLLKDELSKNKHGETVHLLTYRIGSRTMTMTEKSLLSKGKMYSVSYEMKGIINEVHYQFESKGDGVTLWRTENVFRFKGIMALIGPFMKKGLEKQTKIIMRNFKKYVESR